MSVEIKDAIAPAGLIGGAKKYTIIVEEGRVYLLHVGPAATNIQSYNPLERMLNQFLGKRAAEKVAVGEARLAKIGRKAFAQEPHSALLTAADVRRVALNRAGSSLILTINSTQKKYKFILKREMLPEVEEVIAVLS